MAETIQLGKAVADLDFSNTTEGPKKLSQLKGKNVVLYFYPKDNTPGCTLEGQDFRDHHAEFARLDTVVFGISRDGLSSHQKFKDAQCFPFALISDLDNQLCNYFDVIKEKVMYGKKIKGIERSTFLIDKKGVLQKEWRKVKVTDHVIDVLTAIKQFN
jgi:peroxiredoxin Q/BCP